MDTTIDEKYSFKLLDKDRKLTDENIRNFLNASYNLYIDFSNTPVWFSGNPQWLNKVLEIKTQGLFTPFTKHYQFLEFLFKEIHYGKYRDKYEFLKQLLFTLEEDSITGLYRVPSNSKLYDYLTCNGNRYKIFNYVEPESKKQYISISNTQLRDFIELREEDKDTGKEHKCRTIGKKTNDISRHSLPNKFRHSSPNISRPRDDSKIEPKPMEMMMNLYIII